MAGIVQRTERLGAYFLVPAGFESLHPIEVLTALTAKTPSSKARTNFFTIRILSPRNKEKHKPGTPRCKASNPQLETYLPSFFSSFFSPG